MRSLTLALAALIGPGFAGAQVLDLTLPPVATTSTDVPLVLGRSTFDAPRFDGALAAGEALRLTVPAGAIEPARAEIVVLGGAAGGPTLTFAGPGAAAALDGLRFTPPPGFAGGLELRFELLGPTPRLRRVTVAVNAPLDVEGARDALLDGVAALGGEGAPGRMIAFGAEAAEVDGSPGDPAAGARVVAARWGAGRLVALGDPTAFGLTDAAGPAGDGALLVHRALAWLGGRGDRQAAVVTLDPAAADWLRGQGYGDVRLGALATVASDLDGADVFAGPWIGAAAPEPALAAIGAFVRGGGGLLIGESGVGWDGPLAAMPANRLLRQAGVAFVGGSRAPGVAPVERAVGHVGADGLLAALADRGALDADGRARAARLLGGLFEALAADDPLRRRVDAAFDTAVAAVSPTPEAPVSDAWDKALLAHEAERLRALRPEQVTAHRVAAALYGPVPADAPRVLRRVVIDPAVAGWHATGVYAAPGEVIDLEAPPAAIDRGFALRINGHTDDIRGRAQWLRPPVVHWSAAIDAPVVRLASPFGGAVYIDVGPAPAAAAPFEVAIHGAVEQPRFTLGEQTDADWRAARDLPAPQAELRSPRLSLSVPSAWVRTLDGAERLMALWDAAVAAQDALAGHGARRVRAERIDVDVQVAGDDAAGYPIQAARADAGALVDADALADGDGWRWLHALGHRAQQGPDGRWPRDNAYTFDGAVEAVADVFASRASQALGLRPVDDRRWTDAPGETMRRALAARATGAPFAALEPAGQLAMYLQLRDGFGWDALGAALASYRAGPLPVGDQAERDAWLVRASQATGHDLGRFMGDVWGVRFSAEARATVSGLPDWLPAVGGVEGSHRVVGGITARFDLGGEALSHDGVAEVRLLTRPAVGDMQGPIDGVVTYTGTPGFTGADAFEYDVRSSTGHRARTRVTLEIAPVAVTVERWRDVPGAAVADLRADPRFPDRPDAVSWAAAPSVALDGADLGARVRGLIVAPTTGPTVFWIAADDAGELWLSPDHRPEGLARIAAAPAPTAPDAWDRWPEQRSAPVALEAGRPYAFEALMKQRDGPAHLAIAWAPADDPTPRPIAPEHLRPWRAANQPPRVTDSLARVPPDLSTPLALDVEDPDGDPWQVLSARADRGAAQVEGRAVVYSPPVGYEGPAAVDFVVGDGRGGEAAGRVVIDVFETLRVTPLAPLGGWIAGCAEFSWRQAPGSDAVDYFVAIEQGGVRTSRGGWDDRRVELCGLSEGPLSWWVVARDAAGRRFTTPAGQTTVDRTAPTLWWNQVEVPERVCPGAPATFRWAPAIDDGAGLAARPYTLIFDAQPLPPTDALEVTVPAAAGGVRPWALEIRDAVGNLRTVSGTAVIDCEPPPLAARWSGVLTAIDDPTRPVGTGFDLAPDTRVFIWSRGALCFTGDRACDPPEVPAVCTGPAARADLDGPRAVPEAPYGALVAQIAGRWQRISYWLDRQGSVETDFRAEGPLRLAVNHAGPAGCRRPGYPTTVLVGPGLGLVWPTDGEVIAEDRPTLLHAALDPPDDRTSDHETWVDGARLPGRPGDGAHAVDAPLAEGRHTWWVVGHDAAGNPATTASSAFVVDLSPPADFAVTTPAEGAELPRLAVDVCWQRPADVGGIDHYRVHLDARRVAVVDAPEGGPPKLCAAFDADGPGDRCVHVDAYDHTGRSTRASRCFSIALRAPDGGLPEPGDMAVDAMPEDMGPPADLDPPDAIDADAVPDAMPDAIAADAGPVDLTFGDMASGQPSESPAHQPDGCHAAPGRAPAGWPLILLLWLPIRRLRR